MWHPLSKTSPTVSSLQKASFLDDRAARRDFGLFSYKGQSFRYFPLHSVNGSPQIVICPNHKINPKLDKSMGRRRIIFSGHDDYRDTPVPFFHKCFNFPNVPFIAVDENSVHRRCGLPLKIANRANAASLSVALFLTWIAPSYR
jgi:hypothetical protein